MTAPSMTMVRRRLTINFQRSVKAGKPQVLEVVVAPLTNPSAPNEDATLVGGPQQQDILLGNENNQVFLPGGDRQPRADRPGALPRRLAREVHGQAVHPRLRHARLRHRLRLARRPGQHHRQRDLRPVGGPGPTRRRGRSQRRRSGRQRRRGAGHRRCRGRCGPGQPGRRGGGPPAGRRSCCASRPTPSSPSRSPRSTPPRPTTLAVEANARGERRRWSRRRPGRTATSR